MIFVDYLGPGERFGRAREVVTREVAAVLRVPETSVSVRRIVTEDDSHDVELWIELSSDEQLYRLGQRLARGISSALKMDEADGHVWVMYRVVPLSNAFLDGEPRGRGTASFD